VPSQALLLQLAQHLGSYLELGVSAMTEFRSAWVRRVVLVLVAAALAIAGVAALWGAGLVALWETSWRLPYVIASGVLLLGGAVLALYYAIVRLAGQSGSILKAELYKDMELFQEWKRTL
jgi:hypothetical protein